MYTHCGMCSGHTHDQNELGTSDLHVSLNHRLLMENSSRVVLYLLYTTRHMKYRTDVNESESRCGVKVTIVGATEGHILAQVHSIGSTTLFTLAYLCRMEFAGGKLLDYKPPEVQ